MLRRRPSLDASRRELFAPAHRRLRLESLEDRRLLDAATLYVDVDAVGAGNGARWSDAYVDLQSALAASAVLNADADPANDVAEIWIAEGTYRPTERLEAADARSVSFSLVSGVSLLGGFAGGETSRDERPLVDGELRHETTLSGDLGAVADDSDNAYTVVFCGEDIEATLDGLAISDGYAYGTPVSNHPEIRYGGGIHNRGTLRVANSTLSGNSANYGGGAIDNAGTLTISNSTLSENRAFFGGGAIYNAGTVTFTNSTLSGNSAREGGAIYNDGTLTFTNSTLSGNSANYGGGIYNRGTLAVTNANFSGNSAESSGGGISNSRSMTLTNSILSGNWANKGGGGIVNASMLTLTNSTLAGNWATEKGGGIWTTRGHVTLNNTIVALNHADEGDDYLGGVWSGESNLVSVDPQFLRNPSPGPDGVPGGGDDDYGDLRLTGGSPAINAGVDALAVDAQDAPLLIDLEGRRRIAGAAVDLGAYEFQGEVPSNVVTGLSDAVDSFDGLITLREAIDHAILEQAFAEITFDAALFDDGGDPIPQTITLDGSRLEIPVDLRIVGPGADLLTIDANRQSPVFYVKEDVTVELEGLTISGGYSESRGGGISNAGTLTLTEAIVSGNSADDGVGGGGIYNSGMLKLLNSTMSANTADEIHGGGLFNAGTASVMDSVFFRNVAKEGGDGGGIYNSGTLAVTNSALWGNATYDENCRGGGIYNVGALTLTNSTLTTNLSAGDDGIDETRRGDGGGIYNGGTLTMNNAIVARNTARRSGWDVYGDWSGDGNFVGGDPMFVQVPSPDGVDLRLQPGSPAIDAGVNALAVGADGFPLWTDMDGNRRIAGAAVDIGAYEFGSTPYPSSTAWDGQGEGLWTDDARWTEGLPGPTTDATIDGGRVTIDGFAATNDLSFGSTGAALLGPQGRLLVSGNLQASATSQATVEFAGADNGRVVVSGIAYLEGRVNLRAVAALDSLGYRTRTILQADGGLANLPKEMPLPGDHLGYGVFLTGVNFADLDADGSPDQINLELLQAMPGDQNGNGQFNFDDVFQAFAEGGSKYGTGEPAIWTEGDFDVDGDFDFDDVFHAFRKTGAHYGGGPYATPTAASQAGFSVARILESRTWLDDVERATAERSDRGDASAKSSVELLLASWP